MTSLAFAVRRGKGGKSSSAGSRKEAWRNTNSVQYVSWINEASSKPDIIYDGVGLDTIMAASGGETGTHHEMSHSATYSTPTMQPKTDQYISHLSSSASEAGLCESVLNDAYPGYKNAAVELQQAIVTSEYQHPSKRLAHLMTLDVK